MQYGAKVIKAITFSRLFSVCPLVIFVICQGCSRIIEKHKNGQQQKQLDVILGQLPSRNKTLMYQKRWPQHNFKVIDSGSEGDVEGHIRLEEYGVE